MPHTPTHGSQGVPDPATPDDPASQSPDEALKAQRVSEVIAEFSELFAFARTRWARLAEEIDSNLKGASVIILQFVVRKGPITATEIAQMLDMDKAVVSRQVAKLRELGLVDAEPAPEDRRVTHLTANETALGLVERIRERWALTYHERFDDWSLEELADLQHALHRFNTSAGGLRTTELRTVPSIIP